jgi:hypothetical protein
MSTVFDYEQFKMLGGLDLCHFMEPLLRDSATEFPTGTLDRLLADLPTYDEYHLVYALTLGAKHSPQSFATELPKYLAHENGSVWSTALNALDQLDGEQVTNDIVESVRTVFLRSENKAWMGDLLARLQYRLAERQGKKGCC